MAGCSTTPKELMSQKPDITIKSEKSAVELRDCILNEYIIEFSGVSSMETAKEFIITQSVSGFTNTTLATITISRDDASREVKYFKKGISSASYEDPLKKCQ